MRTVLANDYISQKVRVLSDRNPSIVKILWTGGLDSSFTIVYLSRYEVTIEPYYISDNRKSERNELNAMSEITRDILEHPETKCKMLPLQVFKSSEIEVDSEITAAYKRLRDATSIGSQYDWLARFAKSVDGLMLNIEKSENSKIHSCIKRYGYLKRVREGDVEYCVLDEEKSSCDLVCLLKSFHIPLPLLELTKPDTYKYFRRLGFEESANKTWFCFSPINSKPCGVCNPCKSAIGDGMMFRFDEKALKRYEKNKKQGVLSLVKAFLRTILTKLGLLGIATRILKNLRS